MKIMKIPSIFRMLKAQGAFIKLILLAFAALFLLSACIPGTKVIGNAAIMSEITRLSNLSMDRNLTFEDFSKLRDLIKDDEVASDQFKEIDWLVLHNESEHATHGLAYLNGYVQTGKVTQCIAHEMQHMKLYLQHGDYKMVKESLPELDVDSWVKRSEELRSRFPSYYKNFDQVKLTVFDAVKRLNAEDFTNDTIQKLDFLEKNAVC